MARVGRRAGAAGRASCAPRGGAAGPAGCSAGASAGRPPPPPAQRDRGEQVTRRRRPRRSLPVISWQAAVSGRRVGRHEGDEVRREPSRRHAHLPPHPVTQRHRRLQVAVAPDRGSAPERGAAAEAHVGGPAGEAEPLVERDRRAGWSRRRRASPGPARGRAGSAARPGSARAPSPWPCAAGSTPSTYTSPIGSWSCVGVRGRGAWRSVAVHLGPVEADQLAVPLGEQEAGRVEPVLGHPDPQVRPWSSRPWSGWSAKARVLSASQAASSGARAERAQRRRPSGSSGAGTGANSERRICHSTRGRGRSPATARARWPTGGRRGPTAAAGRSGRGSARGDGRHAPGRGPARGGGAADARTARPRALDHVGGVDVGVARPARPPA